VTRVFALVVVAGLVAWSLALFAPASRRSGSDPPEHEPAAASAERVGRPLPEPADPRSEAPALPGAPPRSGPPVGMQERAQPEQRDGPIPRRVQQQTKVARLTQAPSAAHEQQAVELPPGEQAQGLLSPEYRELEHDYAHEPRNADWAHPREHRLRGLIREAGLIKQLLLVHCREQTCRLAMEGTSAEQVSELLEVRGLQAATGLSSGAPYSLRGGQLVMYFRPP
jgi:hypothetical protein